MRKMRKKQGDWEEKDEKNARGWDEKDENDMQGDCDEKN
jgi:hypothetical protein